MLPKPPAPRSVSSSVSASEKFRREKRQDHELGDAVAGGDGARRVRVIVQRDGALAAVVRVDHADAVCRAQPLPDARPLRANTPPKYPAGMARASPVPIMAVVCGAIVTLCPSAGQA